MITSSEQRRKDAIVSQARRMFKEDYDRLVWFDEAEAAAATEKRNQLLEALSPHLTTDDGDDANGMKPHIGPLSPGCRICEHGGWGCSWINARCTRNCFYCSSTHNPTKCRDRNPRCKMGEFLNPQDHVEYIKTLGIRGVGLSGGEPLLRFDVLVDHIKAIRRGVGESIYLWLYTNGDLVNPFILKKLKAVGLNEIRFDIAAQDYDLTAVAMAREFIPTVTVEIPCVPDYLETLKLTLKELEEIGLDHLNLHQLRSSQYNYREFQKRNYHFIRNIWHAPIYESEICVLELMQYAVEEGITVPINYCSKIYKDTFQTRNNRVSRARLFLKEHEDLTATGLIRHLTLRGTSKAIRKLAERAERQGISPGKYAVSEDGKVVTIHPDLMAHADLASFMLNIEYIDASRGSKKNLQQLFSKDNLQLRYSRIFSAYNLSEAAAHAWQRLYLFSEDAETVLAEYRKACREKDGNGVQFDVEEEKLRNMSIYEQMPVGLPDVE
jgi:pyruvate formate-lyase activating enzyme-like uncharacterized protein